MPRHPDRGRCFDERADSYGQDVATEVGLILGSYYLFESFLVLARHLNLAEV